ncbi:hypothetical protein CIPAW_07G221400 [Carya illinoinensis]|uniref:Uncharacterized protein n=1 Tax=Carya illinoinensis TaxID=32201 RepID=A0A8T1Q5E0_CARIL|nr:hypothetical protein CIPAW_07G221400 [Carya illinoinensis]
MTWKGFNKTVWIGTRCEIKLKTLKLYNFAFSFFSIPPKALLRRSPPTLPNFSSMIKMRGVEELGVSAAKEREREYETGGGGGDEAEPDELGGMAMRRHSQRV